MRSAFLLMNEIKIYTNQISPSVPCSESRYFILYMLFQSSDDNTMDIKQDVHNASCFILVPDRWEKRDGWPSNCESINILVHWYFKIQGILLGMVGFIPLTRVEGILRALIINRGEKIRIIIDFRIVFTLWIVEWKKKWMYFFI